jgi:hypothetical protein
MIMQERVLVPELVPVSELVAEFALVVIVVLPAPPQPDISKLAAPDANHRKLERLSALSLGIDSKS